MERTMAIAIDKEVLDQLLRGREPGTVLLYCGMVALAPRVGIAL